MPGMDFAGTFLDSRVLLTEAAIVERLRHECGARLDDHVNHAGLLYDAPGSLGGLYRQYIAIARRFELPILVMTPTRRVNKLTLARSAYRERNLIPDSVAFLESIRAENGPFSGKIFIGGHLGCQGDAYAADGALCRAEARRFHRHQVARFAETRADFLFAGIMPAVEEAEGMAEAMAESGLPYILSLMVRKDGRLLDGTAIVEAIGRIDERAFPPPLCYMSNCVHPANLRLALESDLNRRSPRLQRFVGLQANASPLGPEELDGSETLHRTDFDELVREMGRLRGDFGFKILGGCCGTDDRFLKKLAHGLTQDPPSHSDAPHA